ncbi:unnamed protein product [Arabidopsis lyrata]|nr:unnamed protein product [Arabidopsis lyrata]
MFRDRDEASKEYIRTEKMTNIEKLSGAKDWVAKRRRAKNLSTIRDETLTFANLLKLKISIGFWHLSLLTVFVGGGFESKNSYGSGLFQMRIKVPGGNSGGVVTAFYLTTKGGGHDEVDFEFLGNNNGRPITLQTNLFLNGEGNREQRFYVDNIPIRVYKNENGVSYPSKPMQVEASLWNGDDWATDGGRTKINWSYSPFIAHFQDFALSGCNIDGRSNNVAACESSNYWWNAGNYQRLRA